MADVQHRAKEPSQKRTNTWIVAAGLVCVAASICYAIREYDSRSREQVEALNAQTTVMKRQELQRLYEAKLAAYDKATEAASEIPALKSAGAPAPQVLDAVTRFKTLIWGPVSMIGGRDVNSAMALFNGALDADADAGQLQQLSLDLSHVCKNETHDLFAEAGEPAPGDTPDYGSNSSILASMREVARGPEARQVTAQWLALVDAGQYAESWKAASVFFQTAVPQERWERATGSLRKLLGSVLSRKLKSADYAGSVPGAPEGDYMVLQFDTAFSEKNNAVEIVTTMLNKDGQWQVSAYSIK